MLDTICNGTICICKEGLFTLQIADSYNCVPGDPAHAGFTDNSGGLIIALNPNNNTEMESDIHNNDKNVDEQHYQHQEDHGHNVKPTSFALSRIRSSNSLITTLLMLITVFISKIFAQL